MVIIYRTGGYFTSIIEQLFLYTTPTHLFPQHVKFSTRSIIFLLISPIPPYVYRNVYRRIPVNTTLSSSSSYSNHPILPYSHPLIYQESSRTNGSSDTTLPDSHPNHHFPCIINVFHLIYPTLRYTLFHPFDSQLHST
jgi:hypothetical protein